MNQSMSNRRDDAIYSLQPVDRCDIGSLLVESLPRHNVLHLRRAPLTFDIDEHAYTLKVSHTLPLPALTMTLGFTLGDWQGGLTLATAQVERLTAEAGLMGPQEEVDDELKALWLESRLRPLIEAFETAFETTFELHANDALLNEARTTPLELEISENDLTIPFGVSLPNAGADWLMTAFVQRAPLQPISASRLPLPLAHIAGFQDLTLSEWRSLRCGDAVVLRLDESILLANRFRAEASNHDDGSVLSTPLLPTAPGGYYMAMSPPEMPETESGDNTHLDDATLDQVPVRLVCEFGRLEMPLGEIRTLGEGSVLPLSRSLDSVVDLVINGRNVGRGSLVNIGEVVGVRVDQLSLDD